MSGKPEPDGVVALVAKLLGERAHAVGRVGEPVQEQHTAATHGRFHDERAIPVPVSQRGPDPAAREIAVDRCAVFRVAREGQRLDLGEQSRFARLVVGEGEPVAHIGGPHVVQDDAVPWLERRMAPPRVEAAADDERAHDERDAEGEADEPPANERHARSLAARGAKCCCGAGVLRRAV